MVFMWFILSIDVFIHVHIIFVLFLTWSLCGLLHSIDVFIYVHIIFVCSLHDIGRFRVGIGLSTSAHVLHIWWRHRLTSVWRRQETPSGSQSPHAIAPGLSWHCWRSQLYHGPWRHWLRHCWKYLALQMYWNGRLFNSDIILNARIWFTQHWCYLYIFTVCCTMRLCCIISKIFF